MGFKTLKYSYYLLSTSEYLIMIFQMKPPFFHFELKLLSPKPLLPKTFYSTMEVEEVTCVLTVPNGKLCASRACTKDQEASKQCKFFFSDCGSLIGC